EKYPGRVEPKPRVLFRKAGFLESLTPMVFVAVLVIVVISLALEGFDFGFMRDEITKYGLYCITPSSEMPCSDSNWLRQEPPVTFKVLVDQQVVIAISGDEAPERLKNCAVVSRTNWKCEQFTGRDFGFQNGQYWEISPRATTLNARFVSRYQW